MQTFTYKKRGFENLNIHVDRIDNQGLFFMSDIQSATMQHWVLMGFNWTVGYRTYQQMIDLARLLKSILCIFENGRLLECFDFEEDLRIIYSQEINIKDPMSDESEWSEGIGGVIDGPEDVVIDEEVSLKFTPSAGFIFVGWYDKNGQLLSNNDEYNFIVEAGMEIVARSQKRWYNVSCDYDNSMGLVNGLGRYVYGTEVTLTAIGKMGYKFKVWEDGYSEDVRKILVIENINLGVEFQVNDIVVNAQVDPIGAGYITNISNITQEGALADFSAEPVGNYVFDRFTFAPEDNPTGEETEVSKDNPVRIKLLAGRNITARFKIPAPSDVTVTVKTGYNESDPEVSEVFVEGSTGGLVSNTGGELAPGSSFQSKATPSEGYIFAGWYNSLTGGTLLSSNTTYTNNVGDSDMTIYARFQKKWFTVTAIAGNYIESVEVGPSLPPTQEGNGSLRIPYGEGVILSCTLLPDSNDYVYSFDGWYSNGVKIEGEGTTAVIEPVTIDVSWEARGIREAVPEFQMTATAVYKALGETSYIESTEGGTVTPTSGTYKEGTRVTLSAANTPNTGEFSYLFDGYFTGMNEGENLSYSKTYGFNIDKNIQIYARFSQHSV